MDENANVVDGGLGALLPSQPIPAPQLPSLTEYNFPSLTEDPTQGFIQRENEAINNLRKAAARNFDPNSIVQPIRWDDPSYEALQQTFDNPERGYRFQELGFLPGRDNEDYFAKSLSKWEKIGLAWDQMGALAKETFMEQWSTEADFWGNLATGKIKDAFVPFSDQDELAAMYKTMQDISLKNYIPLTTQERSGEYGFGKFATALGQFGFTAGTMGAFATQLGIELLAASLLAPETGGASLVATGANIANKAKRLLTLGSFYSKLNALENTAQTSNKLRRVYESLTTVDGLKSNFGKFYTFSKMYNAAAGEAKFEAAFSYGEYMEKAKQKAREEGRILTLDELRKEEDRAMKVAMNNGITNTGLLFAMNKLNMNNFFRGPFNPQRRYLTELASNIDRDLVRVGGKTVSRFEVPFFSKQGLKQKAVSLGRWTMNSAWEGVQEVAQGGSAKYWESYYRDKYDEQGAFKKLSLIGKTISEHLDGSQAFEEFISGFIIGMPGSAVNSLMGYGTNLINRKQIEGYKQQLVDYAKLINEYENDPLRVFDQRKANLNTQASLSAQMDEAVRNNDIYAYKNLQKEQMRDMIMLGIRTGKLSYMIGNMRDMIGNMTDEEFAQQFGMVSDSTNRKKAMDYITAFETEANAIVQEYDKRKQQLPNPYSNFKNSKPGTPEDLIQKIKYQAWEDAVQDIVFENSNYRDTLARMKNILGDSKDYIGDALYNTYYMMTSDRSVDKEISMLSLEIAADTQIENPTQEVKDRIKNRIERLNALKEWRKSYTVMTRPEGVGEFEELTLRSEELSKEARQAFEKVLTVYQKGQEGADALTPDGIQKAFEGMVDFFLLQRDNAQAVKNISLLASPEGFEENFSGRTFRAEQYYSQVLESRKKEVEKNQNVLIALENDPIFNELPVVQELKRHLNDAMINREYDDVSEIMDMLRQIYEKGELTKEEERIEEKVSQVEIKETEEGDYLILHNGVTYQVFKEEPELYYYETTDGRIEGIESQNVPKEVKDALKNYIANKEASSSATSNIDDSTSAAAKQTLVSKPAAGATVSAQQRALNQLEEEKEAKLDKLLPRRAEIKAKIADDPNSVFITDLDREFVNDPVGYLEKLGIANLRNSIATAEKEIENAKTDAKIYQGRFDTYEDFAKSRRESIEGYKNQITANEELIKNVKAVLKEYDEKLAGLVNNATVTPFQQLIFDIGNTTTVNELNDILSDPDVLKNLTTPEIDILYQAAQDKLEEIEKNIQEQLNRKQKATRKDTDPDFVQEYNETLAKVRETVNAPGVTVKQVKEAFVTLQPILNSLADTTVRNKYISQLIAEQNAIIAEIEKINQAKDINLIKTNITNTLESTPSLTEGIEKVVVILENAVDPALKQEAIDHFDKEFKRILDKQVQQLRALATQGVSSKLASKLLESTAKFRDGIISRVAELGVVSREIAEENNKNGFSLAVDTDEEFTNPTHRWILENINDNIASTGAQKTAIRNLLDAGILTDEDVALFDSEFLVAASELINKGVARIFTIGINKELHRYITLGQKDRRGELISAISDYLADRDDLNKKEANEMATEALDQIDQKNFKIEDVLYTLNIPVTSIISDEQKVLLDKQRKIISELLTGSNLLDFITTLDANQEKVINAQVQEVTASDLVDTNMLRKISKFMVKDANTTELPYELNEIIELIGTDADEKAVTTKINTLVAKYAEKGKPAKVATLKNIFNAIISYSLETENAILNNETSREPLTEDQMYSALSGTQMALTLPQVNQIQEFAINVLLEEAKKKFNAVSGYTKKSVDYNPNMLQQSEDFRIRFSILRQKDAADLRTLNDLISEYGVENNQISIRKALETIASSDFATAAEKELAYRLIKLFGEGETIKIDNNLDSLGDYDSETDVVSINLAAVGYNENQPTYPVETLILHELLHKIIEKDASDPSSTFYKQMKSLIESVKSRPEAKTFYAFSANLAEDEQVREFAIEALTNPAFQYFLSKVPYAKSNKSAWQKFIEFVNKILENLGVGMEDSVLEEALSTFTDLIQFKTSETLLERIYKATDEQLPELMMEVQNSAAMSASLRESMSNLINRKLDDIKQANADRIVESLIPFKTKDKKTYYYGFQNGRLSVVRRTKKGLMNVRSASVINEIIEDLIDSGKIRSLLSERDLDVILSLAGDAKTPGTYASGQMIDDGEIIGDVRFPNAFNIRINLPFKSKQEYANFKMEYFSSRKIGKLQRGALDRLLDRYNRTAVAQYGELLSLLGSRQNIEILIKKGFISVGDPLNKLTLEDALDDVSEDELIAMYNFVLDGGNLYLNEYTEIKDSINKILSKALGVQVNADLQSKIEQKLLFEDYEVEDVDTSVKEQDLVVSSSLTKDPIEDATAYQVVNDDITQSNTAVETNPVRSFYPDGYTDRETGDFVENEDFRKYYFKVREIINMLSTMNFEQLSGIHITLDKDNPLLRWDGSAATLPETLGVVGYLSDDKGNPIVFNKKGQRVGTLDRNNLSDTKGLNDGENQIVYFYTLSNPETYAGKAAKATNPEAFAQLMEARKKVMDGQPQIAALTRISPGQLNKKALINATNQNRQDTRNEMFYEQLNQPNISFAISPNGYLNAIITAPNGVVNRFSLFAPKTRYISVEADGQNYSLSDYLLELMKMYKQMEVDGDKAAGKLQDDLVTFVYNMWLTGMDKNIQIPKKLDKIAIREVIKDKTGKEVSSLNYYNLFKIVNGVVQIDEENAKHVKTYLNNLPINIWKKWLSGEVDFKFPKIEISETGVRTIRFVKKDYKEFLFKEVGMKSNVTEIPAQEYLKSYNSIVHFTNIVSLDRPITPIVTPSTQDLIDNPNAIQDSVKDKGDDADLNNDELDALKKRKRYKVPGYSAIFEKICK